MNADEARARALEDMLSGRDRRTGDAVALPGAAAPDPEIAALADLAAALQGLPPIAGPTDAFRASLAARLVSAPAPAQAVSDATAREARSTTDLVRALDRWLENAGAPSVALLEELEPLGALAEALREMPRPDGPSRSFRRSLAGRLEDAPPPRSAAERRHAPVGGWPRRLWRSTAFTAAAAATVLLFVAFGATYASAGTLPGHPLYPIKRSAEAARLWFSDSMAAISLHMAFGDRRLDEAFAAPGHAGIMLAEFSREATAALAEADAAIARGQPRQRVADPLLAWFLANRTRLIDGRRALPPTAWRGAVALVDEAIRALSEERPTAGAAVPRLADPRDLLASRSAARSSRSSASIRRARGSDDARPPRPAVAADATAQDPLVVVIADAARGRSDLPSEPAPTTHSPPPGGDRPPTARPIRAVAPTPVPTEAPKPATPEPSPSAPPEPEPTGPPVEPTAPPPTATDVLPIVTATSGPTATQPPVETPTVPVLNKPPTILQVGCDSPVIELYGSTTCRVVAVDPEGDPLYYLWLADAPQMVNERQKDAVYYAAWGIGGGKMRVGITALVSDRAGFSVDDPDVARAGTTVEVRSLHSAGP